MEGIHVPDFVFSQCTVHEKIGKDLKSHNCLKKILDLLQELINCSLDQSQLSSKFKRNQNTSQKLFHQQTVTNESRKPEEVEDSSYTHRAQNHWFKINHLVWVCATVNNSVHVWAPEGEQRLHIKLLSLFTGSYKNNQRSGCIQVSGLEPFLVSKRTEFTDKMRWECFSLVV